MQVHAAVDAVVSKQSISRASTASNSAEHDGVVFEVKRAECVELEAK